ncbi:hypothetical protein QJS83_03530 [Bdellovibrio sp. 22V]|uniref:hypothetical protein n=1 Tax=Bdellovibrio TaxID=958 RepID=UPI0025428D8A|nr:hypothetical protein [Bdellovibrio sp. 22V]WII72941.1 hypothetical protein QJS83_03530 [Bdellovibrio sp. 22V]
MRQLILALTLVLAAGSAHAFEDAMTIQVTGQLTLRLQQEADPQVRLQLLEKYKEFLFERLNTVELPEDLTSLPDNSPIIEEFRSLTEYDNYINLIRIKTLNERNCQLAKMRIENSTSREGGVVPEAVEALKVLNALCK